MKNYKLEVTIRIVENEQYGTVKEHAVSNSTKSLVSNEETDVKDFQKEVKEHVNVCFKDFSNLIEHKSLAKAVTEDLASI